MNPFPPPPERPSSDGDNTDSADNAVPPSESALQRQSEELRLLYQAAGLLAKTLDPDAIYDTLHDLVGHVMDCDTLVVSLYTPEDNLIRCAYAWTENRRVDPGQFPTIALAPEGRGLQSRVIRTGEPLRICDTLEEIPTLRAVHYVDADGSVHDQPSPSEPEARSLLLVPINLEGRVLGVAQVMSYRPNAYSDDHLRFLGALLSQVAAASRNAFLYQQAITEVAERLRVEAENARLQAEKELIARQQRVFLREMLRSVTEGRLHVCDDAAELPAPLTLVGDVIALSSPTLQTFRAVVEQASQSEALPDERRFDLLTAAGEASMNAVVHAGGGEAQVCAGGDGKGVVQIWVRDQGTGISEEALHRATLERGYTTAGSLGHGFWLMLRTVDRVYLLTGAAGTTIVLEQERDEPEPFWLRDRLASGGGADPASEWNVDDLLPAE